MTGRERELRRQVVRVVVAFLLGLTIGLLSGCTPAPAPQPQVWPTPEREVWMGEELLVRYYAKHYPGMVDEGLLRLVAQDTLRFCEMVGLGDQADTVLAIFNEESHYKPGAVGDDGVSVGIGQTVKWKHKALRKFWKARGVELGSFDDPTTQVAFAVGELYEMLGYSRGNVWEAVRRYNGSGKRARRYRLNVFKTRLAMFGRPADKYETVDLRRAR